MDRLQVDRPAPDRLRLAVLDPETGFGQAFVGSLTRLGIDADLHANAAQLIDGLDRAGISLVVFRDDGGDHAIPTLHRLRTVSRMPCIVVGEQGDADRSIGLLDAGADDLVPLGTPLPTMLARMRAVLRRGAWGLATHPASFDSPPGRPWRLLRTRRELWRPDGTECRLTTAEFDLFCLLADLGPAPVSREAICQAVFRRRWRSEDRTVDNLVVRLRRKLDDDARNTVRTVQGRGYAFVGFAQAPLREG